MKAITLSSKGQISIPKKIRDNLGIKTGDQFNVQVINGSIILEPVAPIAKSQSWFWSKEVQAVIKEANADFEKGNSTTYTINEFLKELDDRDNHSS
ncbi:Transcriptional regulator AbrB domain protein [Candidatus Magnetoovum chiemensis]|nr:Transcriptional regulator AbrB domain protein [Candidatus Magnetoovum chiemensis]